MKSIAQIQELLDDAKQLLEKEVNKKQTKLSPDRIEEVQAVIAAYEEVLKDPTELTVLRLYYRTVSHMDFFGSLPWSKIRKAVYGFVLAS